MRTKVIIEGLKNTQKFRVVINGIIVGDCQVKDLMGNRFLQTQQRAAVWEALDDIARSRRIGFGLITGSGRTIRGYDVQVDLI